MKIGGFTFPEHLTFDDHVMHYNGGGERIKFFIKIYVMTLYAERSLTTPTEVIISDVPRCVRMVISTPLVTNTLLAETIITGFKRSTHNNQDRIKDEIQNVVDTLTKMPTKFGDYFDIVYTPERGMSFYKNDHYLGGGSKDIFLKESTFGIWFGDTTTDKGLRTKMLNGGL